MNDGPAVRPASTVLTVRDTPEGYEILMLRRSPKSEFMAGVHVFPGGAVDASDAGVASRVVGWNPREAAVRGLDGGGLAHVVAALRELFEEAGLLVARHGGGRALALREDVEVERFATHRAALNAGTATLRGVLEAEDLYLDATGLCYLANWVTPVGPPRRYDTRFFVVRAPEGQIPTNDRAETVDERWLRPSAALAAHDRGEFPMVLPTVAILRSVAPLGTVAEVLAYARGVARVARVEPHVVERDGSWWVEAPGVEGAMAVPEGWRGGATTA
jgi:8-oxo-dGTP pyrophosphatase MutT (NUDIX family)